MSLVKLILREDVPGLGHAGELVSVKPGYARNYLLPQDKALVASAGKVAELEHHKRAIEEKVAKELKDLETARKQLEKLELSVTAQAGEEGKLFGSVTAAQVAELLAAKGYEIDRRKLDGMPIKELGEHEIGIKLHRDLVAKVKLNVTAAE